MRDREGFFYLPDGGYYLLRDGCQCELGKCFSDKGELDPAIFEATDKETALRNPGKAILYGFTNEQVKSFFVRAYEIINSAPNELPMAFKIKATGINWFDEIVRNDEIIKEYSFPPNIVRLDKRLKELKEHHLE